MRQRLCLVLALLLVLIPPAAAQELKPFVAGSIKEITAARQGKPFILGMWSLTCTHCREELVLLSDLLKKHPDLDLILISTDTPEEGEAISATLRQSGLGGAEAWVFADPFAERLRFEIDPKWHGELPRTYLYDSSHKAQAFSGKLDALQMEQWVQAHFAAR
ncbi:TlpA family protein disulfide reductase [Sulfuricella sp.]|uniref:TlpA family protein disulfide reductase n=1 Tax=Sulfuricella sp. TaxID=2099377 RepID=UPI002C4DB59D|nr:TlpA family protein disulfide reductase [Sulfuricella sp.]HUX62574.1 TlpA family protein disulfide reductase [Sulfuricella sp.]